MFVGADIGGTFTDVAAYDDTTGEIVLSKVLTTPHALEVGVRQGVRGPWLTSSDVEFADPRIHDRDQCDHGA